MKNRLLIIIASFFLPGFFEAAVGAGFRSETPQCSFATYLKNFVRRESKLLELTATNTFSVSTKKETRPDGEFWVLWHEKKRLFLIYWPVSSKEFCNEGRSGRRNLDLTKDVVPTPDETRGSTYLVDEAWASRVMFDAIIRGPTFSISK